jgi:carboxyl-terminal processing protease
MVKTAVIQKILKIVFVVLTAAILGGGVFYSGYYFGTKKPDTVVVKGVTNIGDEDVKADFGVFWQAWKKLKTEHTEGEKIGELDLVYGAVNGLTNSFKDPNTNFFPPADSKKFEEDITGTFGGIGAEIGIRNDQLVIIAPLKDSPAERAGLLAADKILKVDDKETFGLNVNEAVKLIRGEIGTEVVLTILRNGWENSKEFKIIREEIRVPTVNWKIVDDRLVHFQIFTFSETAPQAFYKAISEMLKKEPRGIILDLRNNPGGYLEISIHLAGWFMPRGKLVVTQKFRSGEERPSYTTGMGALREIPLVVLVNRGSASASEILAGALRYNQGAKLIGEKTFGKGSVQQLFPLKDGSSLKITVAQWLLPDGSVLEKNGLKPDVEVKMTEEDIKAGKDPQLEKAIDVLKSEFSI